MKKNIQRKRIFHALMILSLSIFLLIPGAIIADDTKAAGVSPQEEEQKEKPEKQKKPVKEKEVPIESKIEETMIVTATRGEMDFYSAPTTASVITADEIQKKNPQNVTELLNSIPGVEVSGTGAAGSFRGIPSIRGWSSNRVLILVDGQRINNTRESTDFAGIIPAIVDVHQVERIEVVKGAGAVLYGSDALGGVINIITKKPEEGAPPIGGMLDLRYSAADSQKNGRIEAHGTLGFFSYRFGYTGYDADNYHIPETLFIREDYWRAGTGEAKPVDFVPGSHSKGSNFDFSAFFIASEKNRLSLDLYHRRTRNAEFPVSLDNLEFINFNPDVPVIPFSCNAGGCGQFLSFPVYDWNRLNLSYTGKELGFFDAIEANLYYQKTDKESLTSLDFLIAPPPAPGDDPISFPLSFVTASIIRSTGINVKFNSKITNSNQLTYGIDFYEDTLDETHFTDGERDEQSVPDSSSNNYAVYIQNTSRMISKLTLITAFRYDWNTFHSETDPFYEGVQFDVIEKDPTWNVAATYSFTPQVNGYVNIGRSFRAPNLQERSVAGAVSVGGYFIQNPDLSAETNTNYEIGVKTRFDKMSGEAAIYLSRIHDLITAVEMDDPATPFTEVMLQNINKVKGIGGEFSLHFFPIEGWTFSASYSRMRRVDSETDEKLAGDPPQKLMLSALWESHSRRLYIEGVWRIVDRMKKIDDPAFGQAEVPGYGVHSLRGGYVFNRYLMATITINNLFNKSYFESLSPNWWAPERNFVLGLSTYF